MGQTQTPTDDNHVLVSVTTQAPNLAASLSHPLNPAQPTMLFNAHIQSLPLSAATVTLGGPVSSSINTIASGVSHVDSKPGRVELEERVFSDWLLRHGLLSCSVAVFADYSMLQCCFMSMETIWLVRDRVPWTTTLTFTQLRSCVSSPTSLVCFFTVIVTLGRCYLNVRGNNLLILIYNSAFGCVFSSTA